MAKTKNSKKKISAKGNEIPYDTMRSVSRAWEDIKAGRYIEELVFDKSKIIKRVRKLNDKDLWKIINVFNGCLECWDPNPEQCKYRSLRRKIGVSECHVYQSKKCEKTSKKQAPDDKMRKAKIPRSNDITIWMSSKDAKEWLRVRCLPTKLKKLLQSNIAYNKFWNFSRNCRYLAAEEVRIGLLNPPAWIKKCSHKDNKSKFKKCKYEVCPLRKK